MKYVLSKISPNGHEHTWFSDYSGYKSSGNNLYSIQENYLDVLDLSYYMPNELNSEFTVKMEESG